jgi:hypothetical protein
LTAAHRSENIPFTAEFYVNQASVPLGVAVFSCSCGATQVEYGLDRPNGWSTATDGSDLCPHCAGTKQAEADREAHPA